jgi:RNase H-fold protein (predicted Holliday junction resolvase)
VFLFRKENHPVQALDEEHRTDKGELVFKQQFECSEKTETTLVAVHLPAALVSKDNRKLQAEAFVYTLEGEFVEAFKPVDVHFPKP